jgi:hypothetical protein
MEGVLEFKARNGRGLMRLLFILKKFASLLVIKSTK